MNTKQERAEFEAWHTENYWTPIFDDELGRFIPTVVQTRWEAYQAGRAALQSQPMNSEVKKRPISNETKIRINRNITLIKRLIGNGASKALRDEADVVVSQLERLKEHGTSCTYTLQSQDREDAADMFWDADDTEDCLYAYDEETAVEQMVERAWPTDFPLRFTLQRAVRLPSLNIKVTSMSDCGTVIQYEREAIDQAHHIEGDGE